MKKVTFNLNFSLNEKKELCIPIDESLTNIRVIEASLKVQATSLLTESITAKYSSNNEEPWEIDKLVNLSNDKMLTINISDELQNTIDNSKHLLNLGFENATFENEGQCTLTVEYIPLVEYKDNNNSQTIDLKNSGSAAVNIATGELSLNTPLISSDNNALPLSLNANYHKFSTNKVKGTGLPKNWSLNIQQYLIKNDDKDKLSFTYIDESGKEQIIEESYYYTDNENQKIDIGREELNVNLEGEILFGENKLLKKFSNDDLEQYEVLDSSKNIAQVVEKIKKYKNHPYILSLNLNNGDDIVEYRCSDIEIKTVKRKVKVNTNQMVVKTITHDANIVNLSFRKGENLITLVIDSDPTDSNTLKLYEPNVVDSSPITINCFIIQSYLENVKSAELKLNNVKIFTSLDSSANLKVVSSIAEINGAKLVDYEPEELIQIKQQIKQIEESISNIEDNFANNNQQLILLAISKKYLEKQSEIQKLNISTEDYQTLLQQIAQIDRPMPTRDVNILTETNLLMFNIYSGVNGLNYEFLKSILDYKINPSTSKPVTFTVEDTEITLSSKDIDKIIGYIYKEYADLALLGFTYKADEGSTLYLRKENNEYSKDIYNNKITLEELYDYVKNYVGDQISDKTIEEFYLKNHDFTLSLKDLLSLNFQIDSSKKTNSQYEDKLKTYNEQLDKYIFRQHQLEMQVPVHYLYDDKNIIYGFGSVKKWNDEGSELIDSNIYRLILITDPYENSIFITYESPEVNKIVNITNSAGKTILFNYNKNGHLESIIDSRDRKVEFDISEDNTLKYITHINGKKSFFYDNDENFIILDSYGYGAKFDYLSEESSNIKKVETITSLSALDKIENGKIKYKDGFNKDYPEYKENFELKDNIMTFNYNNYKSTTISTKLPQQENKIATYLFDKVGNIITVYENEFSETKEDNQVKISEYTYQNNELSSKMNNLLYANDYLSDVCFKESQMIVSDAVYFSTNTIIGNDLIPYKSKRYTKFHTLEEGKEKVEVSISSIMLEKLKSNELCKHKTFMVSGWAKADSAFILTDENVDDYPNYDQERKFAIEVSIKYKNKSEAEPLISRSFDWRNTEWQYCSVPVTLKSIEEIENITCYINYSKNTGSIAFSNLSFQEADWQTSEFITKNGIKILVKDSAHSDWLTKTYFNSDNNLPVKDVYINKMTGKELDTFTTYEYTKQGRLLRTIDYNGIVKENVYNDKGTLIKSITYHKDEPATKLFKEQKLDEKNNVIGKVNELGNDTSTYECIEGTNIVSTEIDKDGTKFSFGYDQTDTLLESCVTINGVKNSNIYGYVNDLLISLKHNDFEFKYDYDDHGRITQINIVDGETSQMYLKKEYADFEEITTLGNDEIYRQTFDKNGNIVDTFYKKNLSATEEQLSQNIYDTYGNLVFVRDLKDGEKLYKIFLDKFGNKYKEETDQHETIVITENTFDDSHSNVSDTTLTIGAEEFNYHYEYCPDRPDSQLKEIELSDKENNCILNQSLNYDNLGRLSSINTNKLSRLYSYLQSGDHTSNLVSKLQFAVDNKTKENLTYSYDNKGNITEIRENNNLIARYKYDGLSRIIREDNKLLNKTCTYTYDAGGNILERTEYTFTLVENLDSLIGTPFTFAYPTFGWKDKLMEYNGKEFEYDSLGNPTKYKGVALEWSHGRELDKFGDRAEYTYNSKGIRTSKFANGFTTKFFLNGNKIIAQQDAINTLYFHYGADGLTGFSLNGIEYLYKKNLQNDIIGIYSTNGTQIAKYEYDSWGNCTAKYLKSDGTYGKIEEDYSYNDTIIINRFIAFKNPFRYRSYYYDFETNLYYLNSRYYDPEIGRFINADNINNLTPANINGLNLYSYCLNNPVMLVDENGTSWKSFWKSVENFFKRTWDVIVGTIASVALVAAGLTLSIYSLGIGSNIGASLIGAGVGGFISGIQSKLNGNSYWSGYLGGAISGGFTGFGVSIGPVGALIGGAVGNFVGTIITDAINEENLNLNYALNLLGESILAGLFSMVAHHFGQSTNILNTPGFRDLYAGITVWAEFAFSFLTEKTNTLIKELVNGIKRYFNFRI